MTKVIAGLLFVSLLLVGCSDESPRTELLPGEVRLDSQVPEFVKPLLAGDSLRTADLMGQVTLVNFWATWCAPCMHEIPDLIAAQARYEAQGLQVLGIAMDDPDAVRELMHDKGFNYPSLVGDEQVQQIMEQFGNTLGALPYSVLIAPDGVIRYVELGEVDTPKLDDLMQRFLPQ